MYRRTQRTLTDRDSKDPDFISLLTQFLGAVTKFSDDRDAAVEEVLKGWEKLAKTPCPYCDRPYLEGEVHYSHKRIDGESYRACWKGDEIFWREPWRRRLTGTQLVAHSRATRKPNSAEVVLGPLLKQIHAL